MAALNRAINAGSIFCGAQGSRRHPVLCQNSALLKDHGCNLMHRKVLVSFYQHLMAEAVRSKYSCGFPLERCKLLTRWAFEYFDQTPWISRGILKQPAARMLAMSRG